MRSAALLLACLPGVNFVLQSTPPVLAAEETVRRQVNLRLSEELTAGELASILGTQVWKLDVSVPEGATKVSARLYRQAKGKERAEFGSGIETSLKFSTRRQLLIALVPIGGGDLSAAEKVRVIITGFGVSASSTGENPLYNLGIGRVAGAPEIASDGTFNLIGGYARGTISMPVSRADTLISLEIECR